MKSLALFLPHLDVAGGLGVHARTLLWAMNAVAWDCHFNVLAPARPDLLFPTTGPEPFDRSSTDSRFHYHAVDIATARQLAEPLDPILKPPLAALRPDALYCSYYTGMADPPGPQFITFHDAGFLENPAGFGATAAIRRATIETICPAVHSIHCISHDAQDRICRLLPWDRERTTVIWHALPDPPEVYTRAERSSPPTDAQYFFAPVGAATGFNRARKNLPTAILAFLKLNDEGLRLIIAGTATLDDKVLGELLPPGVSGTLNQGLWTSHDGRITIVPTLGRDEFLIHMRHAKAVLYPSRYEGFGLPTIEAMMLGVPLIAARATSIPEIVGDAAMLVDPDDVDGFVNAMRACLTTDQSSLVKRGRARQELFRLERLGESMREWIRPLDNRERIVQ